MIVQIGGFVLVLVVWTFVNMKSLVRKQQTKVAVVYGGLMGLSAVAGSLLIAGVDLSSLVLGPYDIFIPIGKMILKK
ncbi:hypothetical protein [Paenibacillus humicola]|uniref:hypothetical protein n=1 Tax=Paenibacillus humicola TaxID=3110540 RepID=UPI00237A942B|nr:hypothetical protein [Paenibacillus humicola]